MLSEPGINLRDRSTKATCPHGKSVTLQPGQSIIRNKICACGQKIGKAGG